MKHFHRTFALILAISFLVPLFTISSHASEFFAQTDMDTDFQAEADVTAEELYSKFENDIARFVDADPELGHEYCISEIKPLYDFAGNLYYAVECEPTGYLIYHVNSGTYAEYSLYCDSPYLAYKDNIYYGVTETQFYPDNYITREQAVTMLHRYSDYKNIYLSQASGIDFEFDFADYSSVSKFAKPSIRWAVNTGLMNGERINGRFYLHPKNNITRSELAKLIFMLQRKSGSWR